MSKAHSSVIELNGKVYDLKAGHVAAPTVSKPKSIAVSAGNVMDGFTRRRHATAHAPAPAAPKKVQRSKTLMRGAVKKPVASQSVPKTTPLVKPASINPHRLSRASRINKSSLISRFGSQESSFAPKVAPLPVQPEPTAAVEATILSHHDPAPVGPTHQGHARTLERALQRADSHKQPRHRKAPVSHRAAHKLHLSPRAIKASSAVLVILFIAGFFVYQNVPNLAMRVAAARAGISARLPGYQPAGFSLNGNIEYSPGQIQVSYKSNSDDRRFTITQKAAEQEEVTSSVLGATSSSQVVQQQGKTIYIDDKNRATWVDKGVVYEIDGTDLSSDQLLRLTSSL